MMVCGSIWVRRVVNHQSTKPPTKSGTQTSASVRTKMYSTVGHASTNRRIWRIELLVWSSVCPITCCIDTNDTQLTRKYLDVFGTQFSKDNHSWEVCAQKGQTAVGRIFLLNECILTKLRKLEL